MKRVTGIGGIFFKARDPEGLGAWYRQHLGIEHTPGEGANFYWREDQPPHERAYSVWSPFRQETTYFAPSEAPFMINYRVADLDALLATLQAEGVTVLPEREDGEFGRFAWVLDPEGNKIELWEPAPEDEPPA